jgi:hypothetical protein
MRRTRAWLAVVLASGCTANPYSLDAPRGAAGIEIAPYELHEECVALDRGARFDFYFVSVAPLAFNIHYRDGNAVIMPIVHEHSMRESGQFTADHKDVYCLAWEADAEPNLLEYRLRPLPPR